MRNKRFLRNLTTMILAATVTASTTFPYLSGSFEESSTARASELTENESSDELAAAGSVVFEMTDGGELILNFEDGSTETVKPEDISDDCDYEINIPLSEEIQVLPSAYDGYELCEAEIILEDGSENGTRLASCADFPFIVTANGEFRTLVKVTFAETEQTTETGNEDCTDIDETESGSIDESETDQSEFSEEQIYSSLETELRETVISETEIPETERLETEDLETEVLETEIVESETGTVEDTAGNAGIMLLSSDDGDDSDTEIEAGSFYYYSDGTLHYLEAGSSMGSNQGDAYRYVRYKINGTTYTAIAYCMQRDKSSPTSGTTYKKYTDLDAGGDDKYLRKAMFYGYGGPAWGKTINGYNVKSIFDDYGCSSGEYKLMMHYLLDYLYDEGSGWTGSLSSNAFSMMAAIKKALGNLPDPAADSLTTSQSLSAEGKQSETTKIGSTKLSAWKFTITLEDGVSLVNVTTGNTYTGKGTVSGGDEFYFLAAGSTKSLSGSYKVTCNYPLDFHAVALTSSDSDIQDIGFGYYTTDSYITISVKWPEYGYLYLEKDSANKAITNGNTMYDLNGTAYGVYTDETCTAPATMTVENSDGTTSETTAELIIGSVANSNGTIDYVTQTVQLETGTYYIRETLAGSGYLIDDETIYKVLIESDTTTKVNADTEGVVYDEPMVYYTNLILKKTTKSSTSASIAGGVFKLEFFAGAADTGGMISKTWYLESDQDGNVRLNQEYLASDYVSDSFYSDADGSICLPLGLLRITEIKAPENFTISSDVLIYTFTKNEWTISRNGVVEASNTATAGTASVIISDDMIQKAGYIDDEPVYGGITLDKKDAEMSDGCAQGDGSLEGFVFDVISQNEDVVCIKGKETVSYAKGEVVLTLTTDANGHAESGMILQAGTYTVVESGQNAAYTSRGTNTSYNFTISEQEQVICHEVTNEIKRGGISLIKADSETGTNKSQGMSSLEGATFAIINASDFPVKNAEGCEILSAKLLLSETPTAGELRELAAKDSYTVQTITTDSDGFATTDSDRDGTDYSLPYGTYYIIETESSYGYWIDENFVGKAVIRTDGTVTALGTMEGESGFTDIYDVKDGTVDQIPRRGDLTFQKVDIDGNYKSYIPFLITAVAVDTEGNETELESHIIVSDGNGIVTTARSHSENTNGFDSFVADGKVTAEGEALLEEASGWGVWFGEPDARNNDYGALYTCYYRITEIQCGDNASRSENLLESGLIYIDNTTGGESDVLSETPVTNAELYTYHPLVDTEIVLKSTAQDAESGTQTVSVKSADEVTDAVSYTHVSADHNYRMETQFSDITDGNRILTIAGTSDEEASVSDDGKWVTKEFRPEKKSGTNNTYGAITMSAILDTTGLNGHTIVAVDYLYQEINGNWILVAKHEDLTDENQMLYVPDIHTNAVDGLTDSRVGTVSDGDYIVDTVTYTNLASRTNYVLVMYVADAETGEAVVTNADGSPCTVTRRIMSNSSSATISGTRVMPEYAVDASDFDGKTLVVVEALYLADEDDNPYGEPVIEYTSTVDEDESIRYPEVHTTASDGDTGDDVGTSSEVATVYDEVVIENVIFDDKDLDGQYTYTVTGKPVYQQDFTDADGVSHKAGDEVETLDGTYDTVTFTSDASGNATFIYADGTTAKGTVTITGYGQNVAKTAGGAETDNSYITDKTAAIATVTVQLIYKVNSSKLEGGTTVVFEDLYHNDVNVASHADITDGLQSVHYPQMKTSASDESTADDVGTAERNATITDTVTLVNLVPGRTYTVSGKLVNQSDGSDLIVNGRTVSQTAEITAGTDGTITASKGEKTTVTACDAGYGMISGTVDLTFTFDAGNLAGETVVVFENLIHNEVIVASHADLKDEGQTVHFPDLYTMAADGYTKDSAGTLAGGTVHTSDSESVSEAVIVDTVFYTNLIPGREYTICGILVNKNTGYELTDANNSAVMAERTFIAGETEEGITADVDETHNSVSGTVDITFVFDGSLLEGTTVVAFEDLIHNGITVGTHSDIDDEDETVHFPKICTTAIDTNAGDEVGRTDETTIVDTVSLWNLVPGLTYSVNGVLMDKATGEKLLIDGDPVTQTETLTVNDDGTVTDADGDVVAGAKYNENMNSVDCTVELTYTLDASAFAGITTVVFEDLIHNDVVVASHADITDLGQSVHFPELHTTAADLETSDHVGTVEEEAVINDVVSYRNLVVGKEYTLTGTLMNRATGLPLLDESGAEIITSVTFTAVSESDGDNTVTEYHEDNNSVDGTYLITFTLDSGLLSGKTVVAYEKLCHNGVEVTKHADINDDDQSVYYPDIHTTAVDCNTGDHVGTIWGTWINFIRSTVSGKASDDAKQVITDTVALSNLVPGQTYVVSGKLYNVTDSVDKGAEVPLVINGEEILQAVTITVSDDGKSITALDGSDASVTAFHKELNSVDGTVNLTYTLDSSQIQGIEVVVFEKLYQDSSYTPEMNPDQVKDEDLVNEHSDITDEGQSVSEISIHTTALDTTTGDKVGSVPDETSGTSIHDEVELAGLIEGMEYTIDGVLVSLDDSDFSSNRFCYLKTDGTLTEDREEAYTETLTFIADETSQTQYLNFALTSDKIQGKSLTVFENIYHNDTLISSHPAGDGDGWDEETLAEQTVYYPAGKTNATDVSTGGHVSMADASRTIIDRVYFENLLAGQEYCITGQLVYREAFTDADGVSHAAGEALTDKVTVSFTATAEPSEATSENGSGTVDSVTRKLLVNGQSVVSGYVSIRFPVDASKLAGANLVAFESFGHNDTDIFTHNDLNDLSQTIKIPKIGTTAAVNGLNEASVYNADGSYADITIVDTVAYKNLWSEDELTSMGEQAKYILKGVLMDKETGKELTDSNGRTYTVYSKPFTPENVNGEYDMKFVINAGDFPDGNGESALAGKTLVVYEELYLASSEEELTEEKRVAVHKDINDNAQTIQILKTAIPETTQGTESAVKTEDALAPRAFAAILLMGASLLVMTLDGKRF